jgi:hypothetical protein
MGQVFHFAEFQYFDSSVARILFRSGREGAASKLLLWVLGWIGRGRGEGSGCEGIRLTWLRALLYLAISHLTSVLLQGVERHDPFDSPGSEADLATENVVAIRRAAGQAQARGHL